MNKIALEVTLLLGDTDIEVDADIKFEQTNDGITVIQVSLNGCVVDLPDEALERIAEEIEYLV